MARLRGIVHRQKYAAPGGRRANRVSFAPVGHGLRLPTLAVLCLSACEAEPVLPRRVAFCATGADLAAEVDPFIGTEGPGNVIPGAAVPHGMVKLSPDTNAGEGSVDAYEYGNDRIEGFSHTHLEGPGGGNNGYSQILLLPTTGPLEVAPAKTPSTFSHTSETAAPGYYAVSLDDYGVYAELTATAHVGVHRYTFPEDGERHVLIDAGHSRGTSVGGEVTIVDATTVQGFGSYSIHPLLDLLLSKDDKTTGRATVYFYAVFSEPFAASGTFKTVDDQTLVTPGGAHEAGAWSGAYLDFAASEVEVRVGISYVSVLRARANLEAEALAKSFDDVQREARALWNCQLNRVQVDGGAAAKRRVFYTALYHTMLQPTDVTETGGETWSGAGGVGTTLVWGDTHYYSDDWCAWDTFRTARPLGTLVEPEVSDDMIASYLQQYREGGWLPKCAWSATGNSRIMIANGEVATIADAIVKGLRGFSLRLAWEAVTKVATVEDEDSLYHGLCGYLNLGTPPEYIDNGYVSHECDLLQSASMTLEYAYDDWCTAQIADVVGEARAATYFRARSLSYRNQWNPETQFMQGRNLDGTFVTPFDPADPAGNHDFCEANSWIYSWFVPHDVPGLTALLGGVAPFTARLDEFFAAGHYDPSNEPSFHTPFLYNLVGAPWQTQARVRTILDTVFTDRPDGLPGNDDAGATSAWIVLAALGIYPVAPGDGVYQLSSPWFTRATLALHPSYAGGLAFVIEAENNSAANRYIQSATLNGKPWGRASIAHADIIKGGTLRLWMGPEPSAWGGEP
ncbi:MAG: glycoside hydrolase family 92 protein [Deltaproteobacteria bacterium]|nr:glycoside hydrolase family 92 protein [Deltaproteobacteria bacterium]